MNAPLDVLQRPMRDLRISVTDRCNFRCTYCMPFDEYSWIDRNQVLTFEEILRLAEIFVGLGIEQIRLTGGEPLVRRNLEQLVRLLAALPPDYLFDGDRLRGLYVRAMKGLIPEEIRLRDDKARFEHPQAEVPFLALVE